MNYDMSEESKAAKRVRPISRALKCCLTAAGLAAACALGAGAHAQSLGTLVQITQGDPFSLCSADNVTSQEAAFGSILYPNTAIEPWVAVDPTDSSRLLVGHQQDRWDDGGSRGLVGNVSIDGLHWSNTIPTGVSKCTGGMFTRASDPWVAFSPLGTAFFFSLVAEPTRSPISFGDTHGGMLVSRSKHHAKTWEAPITLIENNMPRVFNDKNSITADPIKAGFVYAVWDQLSAFPSPGDTTADQLLAENDGVVIARDLVGLLTTAAGGGPGFKFSFTGPTFLAMTSNNGDTWGPAHPIFEPGTNAQTIDNLVVVRPNGDVFDFFTAINVAGCPGTTFLCIAYIKSTDHGATWSGPAFASDIRVVGVVTPDSGGPIRDASILYSVAVDPNNGNLYLAWQDDRFSGSTRCVTPTGSIRIDSIVFSQSTNGGASWSTPVQINQTPPSALHPCRQQAFVPAIVVASDHTVVVTYYDFRNDAGPAGVFEGADYFAVFCKPGSNCSLPGSWVGNEKKLTDAPFSPFNILDAPVARGHFLGDYMGLAADVSDHVFPVFGIPTGHNQTAEFIREISLP